MMKHLWVMLCLLCTVMFGAMSCGEDDSDDDDSNSTDSENSTDKDGRGGEGDETDEPEGTGTSTSSALPTTGPCASDVALTACGDACSFDPETIDCEAAATNIAALCTAECNGITCTGAEQDITTNTAACEVTKTLSCTNLAFGCAAKSDDCEEVNACVDSFL